MRAVVGEETEHELNNSYDHIMEMSKKKTEERDNEDYRLMTHGTQLKIGMSNLKGMREVYKRNVNRYKNVHEIISRKGTTSAQPEEQDMDEWENDEAMDSR